VSLVVCWRINRIMSCASSACQFICDDAGDISSWSSSSSRHLDCLSIGLRSFANQRLPFCHVLFLSIILIVHDRKNIAREYRVLIYQSIDQVYPNMKENKKSATIGELRIDLIKMESAIVRIFLLSPRTL